MSTIEKLAIRGIRAFSPFDEEKIEFFMPLTLILGQNGAGKTVSKFLLTDFRLSSNA
jgi:DNA repair protein RAD50